MIKYCIICLYVLIVSLSLISMSNGLNKYSKEANVKQMTKPFRMMKLNEFWQKALKRLDEQKLKNLMNDFKIQDKDEIALKKIKADGQDKEGLKEAQIRRQLSAILEKYGLSEYLPSDGLNTNGNQLSGNTNSDDYTEKQIFSDKKLDKLWRKAQNTGLDDEQLKILKEELRHHELKIGQYNQLIDDINRKEDTKRSKGEDLDNSMNRIMNEEELKPNDNNDMNQAIKDKHFEIKQNYKRLNDQILKSMDSLKGPENDFEEENVQKLWDLALKSNFNKEELISLREELDHYQKRVQKLRHFELQLEMDSIAGKGLNENIDSDSEFGDQKHLKKKVKELNRKVNKLHNELETRIMQRHIEL